MLESEFDPQRPRRRRLGGILGLVLGAILGALASRVLPIPAMAGLLPGLSAPSSVTQTPSSGLIASRPTATVRPTLQPFGPPPRQDHYWLERPIPPSGTDWVDYTYAYGSRGDGTLRVHRGVEFVNPMGTPVLAAADGTVEYAGADDQEVYGARPSYYGLLVIIRLDRTLEGHAVYTLYGHLSDVGVQTGDRVEVGDIVGHVGMSGVATGPHLHMEVRVGNNDFASTVNPELWLRPYEGKGTLAGLVLSPDGEPASGVLLRVLRAEQPEVVVREVTTYPGREVNPDPYWGENMVCGDLGAGNWILQAVHSGSIVSAPFTIEAGKTTWLTLRVPW